MMALYHEIASILVTDIKNGIYSVGELLPSEAQLMQRFNTSRTTIRRALRILIDKNLAMAQQGKGVYVIAVPSAYTQPAQMPRNVALLLDDAPVGINPTIVFEFEHHLFDLGFTVTLCNTQNDSARVISYANHAQLSTVSGIIFRPLLSEMYEYDNRRIMERLSKLNKPVVMFDGYLPELPCDAVCADNETAAHQLTSHLLELGHRRIAFLLDGNNSSLQDRLKGYRRALAENGLPCDSRLICKCTPGKQAEQVCRELLSQPAPPTAIFCCQDLLTVQVYHAASSLGLTIGTDLAVVGFDNLDLSRECPVPLTTIQQPLSEMAEEACQQLIRRLKGDTGSPVLRQMSAKPIFRQSSCPPAARLANA